MFEKFIFYLRDRLKERSTQVAIIGLLPFLFKYIHIPEDMIRPLIDVVAAFLVTAAITKG